MFKQSEKIVCVDDSNQQEFSECVTKGVTYVVEDCFIGWTDIRRVEKVLCVDLTGRRPYSLIHGIKMCYEAYRFRKLADIKAENELARTLVNSCAETLK